MKMGMANQLALGWILQTANEGIFLKMSRVSLIITSIINKILIKEGADDIQWISYNNFNF